MEIKRFELPNNYTLVEVAENEIGENRKSAGFVSKNSLLIYEGEKLKYTVGHLFTENGKLWESQYERLLSKFRSQLLLRYLRDEEDYKLFVTKEQLLADKYPAYTACLAALKLVGGYEEFVAGSSNFAISRHRDRVIIKDFEVTHIRTVTLSLKHPEKVSIDDRYVVANKAISFTAKYHTVGYPTSKEVYEERNLESLISTYFEL